MKHLKEKLGKTGGFTLVEMLIVVAIIAILIAVSIPMVNSSLEAARDAADQANERSAKAAALMVYMGVAEVEVGSSTYYGDPKHRDITSPDSNIFYDAARGVLTTPYVRMGENGYGKCTEDCTAGGEAADKFDSTTKEEFYSEGAGRYIKGHEEKMLKVYVKDGEVVLVWTYPPFVLLDG